MILTLQNEVMEYLYVTKICHAKLNYYVYDLVWTDSVSCVVFVA